MTCRDCKNYWYCPERSRGYPCTSFRVKESLKENDKNEKTVKI